MSVLSYAWQGLRMSSKNAPASFETWVTRRFGSRLYKIFFKTYSEKVWGIPCTELSEEFAVQRIRKLTLRGAVRNALFPTKKVLHRTLADCFAYPKHGTGMVYERIAERLSAAGGQVFLKCPIGQVLTRDGRVAGLTTVDGTRASYDHVISTMPITLLVKGLNGVPQHVVDAANQLTFRSTILVYLEVTDPQLFRDQWLYIHDTGTRLGRVTNFSNWQPPGQPRPTTSILCGEYWCNSDDAVWRTSDRELSSQATSELKQIGLVHTGVQNSHVIRIPRSYPVYKIDYRQHFNVVSDYLKTIHGLSVIGRYGSFKYNNQDHSILMGLLAADNVLNSCRHNLWDLNADFDAYQEESYISETGLVTGKAAELLGTCS